jgi:hypothetical protein
LPFLRNGLELDVPFHNGTERVLEPEVRTPAQVLEVLEMLEALETPEDLETALALASVDVPLRPEGLAPSSAQESRSEVHLALNHQQGFPPLLRGQE